MKQNFGLNSGLILGLFKIKVKIRPSFKLSQWIPNDTIVYNKKVRKSTAFECLNVEAKCIRFFIFTVLINVSNDSFKFAVFVFCNTSKMSIKMNHPLLNQKKRLAH
jgi:hypothetical protein